MFTRDQFQTDRVRKSDGIGLLFTQDLSGTGTQRIQDWICCFAGPVLDQFGYVPERLQNGPV